MRHPVNSCIGWRCPRATLPRRQYRTSITIVTNRQSTSQNQEQRFRTGNAVQPWSTGHGRATLYGTRITTTVMMKFFATFCLPLLIVTVGIHAVAAADQIVLPNAPMDANRPLSNARPTLFDLLTIESRSSIFFSYARELQLSRMFVDMDSNLTLLVPTNKAVMALARKP